jgi:endonuclease/exonuclease/phosphatase family metal-dependent hydrolase
MHIRTTSLSAACTLVLVFILLASVKAQEDTTSLPVRLMFYNVENFFDTYDDPLKNDNEFLPGGVRRWNITRYNRKISSIYKAIVAAGEWSPPAIVAFCEVENRRVLEDLVFGTYLSAYNYGIIHEDSPDERGIDVCLIYRKDLVTPIDIRSWIPSVADERDFHTRSVLYMKCSILGDTIHIMVNHWPSRRGGVLAGESMRTGIAAMVRNASDSLASLSTGHSKTIIMGDFNCNPEDYVIKQLTRPDTGNCDFQDSQLVNLAYGNNTNGIGTYHYSGAWEIIDQIIVSEWLIKCSDGLSTDKTRFRIFRPDFLLIIDPKYPGLTTFSTYRGYRYQGGFSDHLPVLLDLVLRQPVYRKKS